MNIVLVIMITLLGPRERLEQNISEQSSKEMEITFFFLVMC